MLTRELLIFRRVKGNLRPTFIDVRDEPHLLLAASLIEIFEHGIGETRGTLDEALGVLVGEAKKQKFARGLVKLLQDHFVLIYVDQDARPDISNRYQDWGWPATIIFDAKGVAQRRHTACSR